MPEETPEKVYVVARDYADFKDFHDSHAVRIPGMVQVTSEYDIDWGSSCRALLVGEFRLNPMWGSIQDRLRQLKASIEFYDATAPPDEPPALRVRHVDDDTNEDVLELDGVMEKEVTVETTFEYLEGFDGRKYFTVKGVPVVSRITVRTTTRYLDPREPEADACNPSSPPSSPG